ncbi:MAG: DHH family phosphoesterase [bacterium]|nr:DHH family phosphoesterase [bacterium]
MSIIVTAGDAYTDIDILASAVAYKELLCLQNKKAMVVLTVPLNQSVTGEIRRWGADYLKELPAGSHQFVIVDVSDPKHFAPFVEEEKIIELFDHRTGFESYWQKRLGDNAKIEPVGACATLIFEEYKKSGLIKKISPASANLLYVTIFTHTLNFQSSVTTERDKAAFRALKPLTALSDNWADEYYEEREKTVYSSPLEAIIQDTKVLFLPGLNRELVIGQLELWDSSKFIKKHLDKVEAALVGFGNEDWFFTSPSISEGKTYLFTKSKVVKELLEKALNLKFSGDLGEAPKLYLRKEILKKLQEL